MPIALTSLFTGFLSHLSGDEEMKLTVISLDNFLSHLSGDEVSILLAYWLCFFLSHLSGDEGR